MKDKNGIEICCENCDDFVPAGTNGRGCALYEEDCEDVFGKKKCAFKASSKAYEARIAELQAENALLKESRFTNNELNLIRNTFQDQIREDKCGWSAEKRIIAKCDRILKERKDNNGNGKK